VSDSDEETPDVVPVEDEADDDDMGSLDTGGDIPGEVERKDMECLVWALCTLQEAFGGNMQKATIEALECSVVSVAGKISSRPLSD
jgi:hypothetical protein